jgi:acetolactate synthase-1/2/3 large subunit
LLKLADATIILIHEARAGEIKNLSISSPHKSSPLYEGVRPMNGAQNLIRTLVNGGVEVCFTNPGTSEMHFVAALDQVEGMRAVLGLFEGVCTGSADGYARMTGKPASTIHHLGPGMRNCNANLHNPRRENSPLNKIDREHAT